MATAAELKARLAKYAIQQPQQTSMESDGNQRTVLSTATTSSAPALGGATVGDTKPDPAMAALAIGAQRSEGLGTSTVVVTESVATEVMVIDRPATSVAVDPESKLDRENPVHFEFLNRLQQLEESLLAKDPLMKTHLGTIHKTMLAYEEIPNLLSVDQISKIMEAQQVHTDMVLKQEVVKGSKSAASKKAAKLTLDDV